MKTFLTLFCLTIVYISSAQTKKEPPCMCETKYKVNYPEAAAKANITGTVTVKIDVDANCIESNPRVVKSLGYGCDEEALRVVNIMIQSHNECMKKCGGHCNTKGMIQTIRFVKPATTDQSFSFNTARNASWGTSTDPIWRMRFLPSFCFSSSLRLRLISPP